VAHRIPFVEIAVNYRSRVGESSVTGSFWKALLLGIQMIVLVLGYRFGFHRAERTAWTQRPRDRADCAYATAGGGKSASTA
jgi:hypothetical protein